LPRYSATKKVHAVTESLMMSPPETKFSATYITMDTTENEIAENVGA